METLSPELERQIQVEELWARRMVLAKSINASRLETYNHRRMLIWSRDLVVKPPYLDPGYVTEESARTAVPVSGKTAMYCALVIALLAAVLLMPSAGAYEEKLFASADIPLYQIDKSVVVRTINKRGPAQIGQVRSAPQAPVAETAAAPVVLDSGTPRPLDGDLNVAFHGKPGGQGSNTASHAMTDTEQSAHQ